MDNHNHHLSKQQQQQQQQQQEKQQDKDQQQQQQQENHQDKDQQQQQEKQQDKDQQQQEQQENHQDKDQQQQQQEKQQDKDQQQQEQQKHEDQVAETEQKSPTVSQSPLTQKTTHSPPPDPSPVDSPLSSDTSSLSHGFSPPPTTQPNSKPPSAVVSRAELTSRDQSTATTTTTTVDLEEQTQKLGSGSGKRLRPDLSILRRSKRDKMIKKALLGFRISAFVFSLVSFSVLAADKDQGWALDSFYRYKEFRFCLAVNVIGFVYSGIQALYLAYHLTSGKQKPRSQLRSYLDFVLDQILAYLLISASSSAAVRVDDWQSNWGNDKFPQMASASMALSLVAFIALALSSLVSGYNLCTFKSM